MTTEVEARRVIYERMAAEWDATLAPFALAPKTAARTGSAFVNLSVQKNASNQETLGPEGGRKFLRGGLITLQIFTAIDDGMAPSDALVREGRRVFEARTFGAPTVVRARDAVPTEVGQDGPWFQVNLDVAFEYEEQR